jgi:outer membrane protein OmpA-like peptidoglycan-associated protein
MRFGNHTARRLASRASQLVLPTLLSVALFSVTAIGAGPGVSDFTVAEPDQIQTTDLVEALALSRGSRIQPAAPPTVRLPIYFEFDSAKLLPEAEALLDRLGDALMSDDLAGFHFDVEGHTDSVGSAGYNARLSEDRSRAVKAYLISRGVSEEHLVARGHGEEHPAASNATAEGRQRNRRVEVINRGATR